MKKYADIIIDISHEAIDRAFQYEVPDLLSNDILTGSEVMVPFGQGNTLRHGYVIGFTEQANYPEEKIKSIASVCDRSVGVESELISLAAWMRKQYGGTMLQALKTVLPVKEKTRHLQARTVELLTDEVTAVKKLEFYEKKHYAARARLLRELLEEGHLPYDLVTGKLHISTQTLKGMEKEGMLRITSEVIYRTVVKETNQEAAGFVLNDEQQAAVNQVTSDFDRGNPGTYLLHGVTGSGKTEVYMQMISHVVAMGRQAIVLIPEIALTYQTVKRFRRHFGDRVTIMNSRLSKGERYDQYVRILHGDVDVVIGPRSALFVPFERLGLIVIDEEHETSYKSETLPGYHAREVAVFRAGRHGAGVVLGSATPSVISYTRAKQGEYKLLTLTRRAAADRMASMTLVDLRQELKNGNRSMFSGLLKQRMEGVLERGEQMMLFMNRRGYESFLSCRSCGETIKCPHCDVSLTLHGKDTLMCHYCGYTRPYSGRCPACGSQFLAGFSMGTEKLEEEVQKLFPSARTLRMDLDTVKKKGGHEQILEKFEQHEADILIGTQMIVKGHDFPGVTLVGIVLADLSLHDSDYLANEKTFDLLTQAAGRAGRASLPGEVVIQTYQPEHYSITAAMHQDYEMFYEQEISYRRLLKYPPVQHMLVIQIASMHEGVADRLAHGVVSYINRELKEQGMSVIGPSLALLSKVSDIYRRVVYVKDEEYGRLTHIKDVMERVMGEKSMPGKTWITFDFDPMKVY